jgi:Fe-S-cluster containining protein
VSATDARPNPCVNCGACCAHFRVQFYWREANAADHSPNVPSGFFEELTSVLRCMSGTNDKHRPQCRGLQGKIGRDAKCGIYLSRPTPCRDFRASYADGRRHERCDQARARHGLKALSPADWEPLEKRDPSAP